MGEGGGVNPSGQPDCFSQFFFDDFPKGPIKCDIDDAENYQESILCRNVHKHLFLAAEKKS